MRPVVVGDYYGEKEIVILTGLHAGDRVVVDGVLRRSIAGQPVKIVEPGAAEPGKAGAAAPKAGRREEVADAGACSPTSSSTGRSSRRSSRS